MTIMTIMIGTERVLHARLSLIASFISGTSISLELIWYGTVL